MNIWNIYYFKNKEESRKVFGFVHDVLKNRIIIPVVNLVGRIIDKRVDSKIQYRNDTKAYFVFERALDSAKNTWFNNWALETYGTYNFLRGGKRRPRAIRRSFKRQFKLLETFKKILFAVCKYDTAYDALFKILMFEITAHMQNSFPSNPHIPLYCSKRVDDISYLMVNDGIVTNQQGERYIVQLQKITEDEYTKIMKTKGENYENRKTH